MLSTWQHVEHRFKGRSQESDSKDCVRGISLDQRLSVDSKAAGMMKTIQGSDGMRLG